jgi:hypothetical protein
VRLRLLLHRRIGERGRGEHGNDRECADHVPP